MKQTLNVWNGHHRITFCSWWYSPAIYLNIPWAVGTHPQYLNNYSIMNFSIKSWLKYFYTTVRYQIKIWWQTIFYLQFRRVRTTCFSHFATISFNLWSALLLPASILQPLSSNIDNAFTELCLSKENRYSDGFPINKALLWAIYLRILAFYSQLESKVWKIDTAHLGKPNYSSLMLMIWFKSI